MNERISLPSYKALAAIYRVDYTISKCFRALLFWFPLLHTLSRLSTELPTWFRILEEASETDPGIFAGRLTSPEFNDMQPSNTCALTPGLAYINDAEPRGHVRNIPNTLSLELQEDCCILVASSPIIIEDTERSGPQHRSSPSESTVPLMSRQRTISLSPLSL